MKEKQMKFHFFTDEELTQSPIYKSAYKLGIELLRLPGGEISQPEMGDSAQELNLG